MPMVAHDAVRNDVNGALTLRPLDKLQEILEVSRAIE